MLLVLQDKGITEVNLALLEEMAVAAEALQQLVLLAIVLVFQEMVAQQQMHIQYGLQQHLLV